MGHMFIINAPYLFSTVWSLIKPWLDEATVRKIHILGKSYKAELQQYISAENLPVELGGTYPKAIGSVQTALLPRITHITVANFCPHSIRPEKASRALESPPLP
ncbi:hypothetical protein AYX14_04708 [Cryptococcus neoformans]|nr:hypothetical protein AYX14_04708 [Cryptococcus neoformans var. grubii]